MLETIREYGLEQLAASGEETMVRDAHASLVPGPCRAGGALLAHGRQGRWVARLDAEHDNLRAALAWLAQTDDTATGVRLAGRLAWFWFYRNHWAEGRGWLERALAWSAGNRTIERVRVLNMAAYFALFHGEGLRRRLGPRKASPSRTRSGTRSAPTPPCRARGRGGVERGLRPGDEVHGRGARGVPRAR